MLISGMKTTSVGETKPRCRQLDDLIMILGEMRERTIESPSANPRWENLNSTENTPSIWSNPLSGDISSGNRCVN